MNDPKRPSDKGDAPVILDLEADPLPEAPSPAEAPPVDDPPGAAEEALRLAAGRKRTISAFGALIWAAFVGLVLLAIGAAASDFLTGLFARHPALGWIATGFFGVLISALLVLILREAAALGRLKRVERLQTLAGRGDAKALIRGLDGLYRGRADLEAARSDLTRAMRETPDAETLLSLAERKMLHPLDARAEAAVARAARDVAAATALIPMALADVLAVLWANLRMIRRIAEIYGGRAGWLGSWRLLRAVAVHLIATGAVAATDEMLGPLLGGGMLSKLSRRFGEAAVNAALTARVGVAAMEVCRPMPFAESTRPRATSLVLDALKGWRARGAD
ncbi:MAG: TIGR01620 family protein [Pseudomonadota bacterium]